MTVDTGKRTILSSLTLTVLLLGTLLAASVPCTAEPPRTIIGLALDQYSIEIMASPNEDAMPLVVAYPEPSPSVSSFTVGLNLETYSIEMMISTEEDTKTSIKGWVNVNDMRPVETVSVQIESTGFRDLYAYPEPGFFIFERDGKQYFNLTLVLLEDTPPQDYFDLVISATAKTPLNQVISFQEMIVTPVFLLSAESILVSLPEDAPPGETPLGTLRITNTGSIYSEYRLVVVSDPDLVVDEIGFYERAELVPGFYDEFEFYIAIVEDATTGTHSVDIELWAHTQYEIGDVMDTFTIEVQVEDTSSSVTGPLLLLVVGILAIVGVTAHPLRRKA
ncbi:MAG: hypothetical protein GQ558_03415 [Thermoplasmata archaeon]|nr:hypothetical protein [Thermoplasmata archaeon]